MARVVLLSTMATLTFIGCHVPSRFYGKGMQRRLSVFASLARECFFLFRFFSEMYILNSVRRRALPENCEGSLCLEQV